MEFTELFEKAKIAFGKADISGITGKLAYQFDITDENGGTFFVEIKNGCLRIEPHAYNDRDVKFTLSSASFEKMLARKLNSAVAYATGKLKIEGELGKALELKKLLGSLDD